MTEFFRDGLKMVSIEMLRENMIENWRKRKNCPDTGGPEEVTFRHRSK